MKSTNGSGVFRILFAVCFVVGVVEDASAYVGLRGRVLVVDATDGDDQVKISTSGTSAIVTVNRIDSPRFRLSSFDRVDVQGFGGNDIIDMSLSPVRVIVDGGAGSNWILGSEYDDMLWNGIDNYMPSLIVGGGGHDVLIGSLGDDTILGGAGDDFIVGGDGNDTLRGGAGNDHLIGDSGRDRLYGDEGDDYIEALDGWPGEESDQINGGPGRDTIDYSVAYDRVTPDSMDVLRPF